MSGLKDTYNAASEQAHDGLQGTWATSMLSAAIRYSKQIDVRT